MSRSTEFSFKRKSFLVLASLLFWIFSLLSFAHAGEDDYVQTNLVSDIAGVARFTDPNLVNAWGIVIAPKAPVWIADNATGVSTIYSVEGRSFPPGSPLVVTIPPPAGSPPGTTAAPTGIVFNATTSFVVKGSGGSGPALFIFATEDGTISGWNPQADLMHAILAVDRSTVGAGAVYKGLAIGTNDKGNFIYATNFRFGTVEMFDGQFNLVRSFTDSDLSNDCPLPDQCFAPFGIRNIDGNLYVTYALQKPGKHDDQASPGNGFVDVFDTSGNLIRRFASHGTLNSPWGLALAPNGFGVFSRDVLVGNFGDGRINAFDRSSGSFAGQLEDTRENPITINGLWGLSFGNGTKVGGPRNTLFFTAGIADETHGLFGSIRVANRPCDFDQQ